MSCCSWEPLKSCMSDNVWMLPTFRKTDQRSHRCGCGPPRPSHRGCWTKPLDRRPQIPRASRVDTERSTWRTETAPAPPMTGLINSENSQRTLHQLRVCELCPSQDILSVMYITD